MKNTFTLIALFILTNILAQTPEKFSYQAVIRNSNNDLVANTQIGMQISILKTSISGSSVYTETHLQNTNANGLVSLEIGTGNTTDNFSNINWSNDTYFVKTETDPTGGTNYTISGTSQLLSVPYALHAKTATSIIVQSNTNRNYTGFTESFKDGIKTYRTSFSLTLNDNNQYTGIETVDVDFDPSNPNQASNVGNTTNVNGTYTEDNNKIILSDIDLTLNKVGNKLTLFERGNITFEVQLTLTN